MTKITVKNKVKASPETIWSLWSAPEHIVEWSTPSEDWHTVRAENDLRTVGKFLSRMEAKDGSFGFDFDGTYDQIKPQELITYTMGDGRKVQTHFNSNEGGEETEITITFDAETENPIEQQREGWQSILDNFKKYVENFRDH